MVSGLQQTGAAADAAASDPVRRELEVLKSLDLYELQVRWRRTFGRSAPTHLARPLMLRILAYKLQASAFGDLDPVTVRLLDQIARNAAKARTAGLKPGAIRVPPVEETRRLKPGTVLMREHAGEMQRVTVLASGYKWNGETFRSLSEVARAMTGTRWNGPRFFGLRQAEKGRGGLLPAQEAAP
jgi:hypothetical protein